MLAHIRILKDVRCVCNEEEKDMATVADKNIAELRKKIQLMNKDIPILEDGKKDAIELDPNNPSHKEWYEGR